MLLVALFVVLLNLLKAFSWESFSKNVLLGDFYGFLWQTAMSPETNFLMLIIIHIINTPLEKLTVFNYVAVKKLEW